MIWKSATLINLVETGETDTLGNAIKEEIEVKTIKVRFTPWTKEEIGLEGREVTLNQRKMLCRLTKRQFPACKKIRLDSLYEIKKVIDLGRFVLLYVKEYKV